VQEAEKLWEKLKKLVKKSVLFLIYLFFLVSCAKNQEEILYSQKGCEALYWELDIIERELPEIEKRHKEHKKDYTGLTIVGTGAVISGIYLAFSTSYFYVLPALTIVYYNTGINHNEVQRKLQTLTNKKDMITNTLKERSCKKH